MTLLDEIEKMSNPELEALKERSLKQQQAQTVGQAAASVAPGLIGMLVGGTNDFRARQFDKGNQLAESAGKQYLENQKNLKEVELDGQPRYVTGQEALYEKPYKTPERTGLTGSEKGRYQLQPIYNHASKKYETVIFDTATKEIVNMADMVARPSSPKITQERTGQGGLEVNKYVPYDSTGPKTLNTQFGVGNVAEGTVPEGVVSKEEAGQYIKDAAKAKDKKVKIVEAKKNAEQSVKLLSDPSATPEELAAGIQLMLKAVNKERLSDPDAARLQGDDLKSLARTAEDVVSGKFMGQINPKTRQGFINVAKSFIKSTEEEMKSMDKLYIPKGRLPEKGQKRLEKTSVGPATDKDAEWKKRKEALKGIK